MIIVGISSYLFFSLLGHIGTMSHHRMNVSEDIIRAFKNKCLETNEPSVIAKKMEQIASDCTNTRLDATLMSRIYTLINNFTYDIYDLNKESKQLFDHRLTIIYSHLAASSNMSHKFSIILKFRRENKGRNFADKPQMLLALMTEFELNDEHRIETNCLPFDAFQTSGYRMDAITRFGATFMQDYYSLIYTTVMCANISFYQQPEQADYFTRRVEQILEPVTEFIDKWFVQTLDSTWPEMERTLVQNIIFDFAKNADIPENNETYAQLVDKIYKDMEPIGHPGYSRQYIVTKAWRYDTYSMQFGYGCKPNRCTVASSMDAHCTMLRVDTSTNRALVNFDNLLNFSNTSFPTFFNAMNTEFYEMYFVSNVVDKLGKNYGLYLDRFNNHSSFVILRYFQYFKGCANTYAIKPTKDLGYEFIQLWTYHTDGGLTTDCEHWNVFLTN
ncbi:hypothetical protein M3Y98_00331900 [Aphelenchoides besseyi]|nr:hypothetical protein M3Y98_00331900 [Aphelenchoides besseyi]